MKRFSNTTTALFLFANILGSQTGLKGVVTEESSGEKVPFATVVIYQEDSLVSCMGTDLEGDYSFENVEPGTYQIYFEFLGFETTEVKDVTLRQGEILTLNGVIVEEETTLASTSSFDFEYSVFDNHSNEEKNSYKVVTTTPSTNISATVIHPNSISMELENEFQDNKMKKLQ